MKRRTVLVGLVALPVVSLAGTVKYVTPVGDEPIFEVLCGYYDLDNIRRQCWVEWPFEDLVPGDIFRRKREPKQEYEMTTRISDTEITVEWDF